MKQVRTPKRPAPRLQAGSPTAVAFGPRCKSTTGVGSDRVVQTILFSPDVALETTYFNDVRFDLRRGEGGMAFIADSSDSGPNGIIVVDLASGEGWRRLHDHPSTKCESGETFRPIVEGRPLAERPPDGPPSPMCMGSDSLAIAADGARLYYAPLTSRRLYSVSVHALVDGASTTRRWLPPSWTRATRAAEPTALRPKTRAASWGWAGEG